MQFYGNFNYPVHVPGTPARTTTTRTFLQFLFISFSVYLLLQFIDSCKWRGWCILERFHSRWHWFIFTLNQYWMTIPIIKTTKTITAMPTINIEGWETSWLNCTVIRIALSIVAWRHYRSLRQSVSSQMTYSPILLVLYINAHHLQLISLDERLLMGGRGRPSNYIYKYLFNHTVKLWCCCCCWGWHPRRYSTLPIYDVFPICKYIEPPMCIDAQFIHVPLLVVFSVCYDFEVIDDRSWDCLLTQQLMAVPNRFSACSISLLWFV